MARIHHDGVLVVGAGLAGLTAALAAAPASVLILTDAALNHGCSSAWAQGGVAAALGSDDAPSLHAIDTINAGAGLVVPDIARLLAEEGPDAVRRLAALGAPFDRNAEGGFAQSLEAAHSRARVARVKGDQAGRAIMDAVTVAVLAAAHIQVRTGAKLIGLLQDATGRQIDAAQGRLAVQPGAFEQAIVEDDQSLGDCCRIVRPDVHDFVGVGGDPGGG